jgi:diadenosine tetraphosphatase ApaH/serine/threonine PP2A family protein phosphatase
MRVAVISDVHANGHALEAVLAAIDEEEPDALWCLGDTVGYGPAPNECCAVVERRTDLCLVGNHDLAVLGRIDLDEFTGDAAAAARWTRGELGDEARAFLERLEPTGAAEGVELFHASPTDPVWDYVLSGDAALEALELTTEPLVLVGHSHVALQISLRDNTLDGGLAPAGTELDLSTGRFLVNPGSVGQPRDGDARAAWLLLDLDHGSARFHRVPYPVERTQAEIRERGLPESLAARLAHGH